MGRQGNFQIEGYIQTTDIYSPLHNEETEVLRDQETCQDDPANEEKRKDSDSESLPSTVYSCYTFCICFTFLKNRIFQFKSFTTTSYEQENIASLNNNVNNILNYTCFHTCNRCVPIRYYFVDLFFCFLSFQSYFRQWSFFI